MFTHNSQRLEVINVRPAESDVKKFLRAALRQRARAVVSLEVMARAAGLLSEHQHITDVRVFKRAKKSLGIKSMRAGFGARSRWLWQLPRLNQDAREEDATPQPQPPIDWVDGVARLDPDRPPSDVPRHRWRQFVEDCKSFLSSPCEGVSPKKSLVKIGEPSHTRTQEEICL